ncbi:MAG: hypothetical protein IT236_03575 [Bacteroidia bacterium]|nr:hypothetical protein [Bacteroidia bacterium]
MAQLSDINLNSNPVETRVARVFRDEAGVISVTLKDCGLVDEFDIMDLNLVIRHLAQHKMALKLLIISDDFEMSKEAKLMAEKEDNISKTIARAIVVSNKLKASLFNFFMQFGKTRNYPQQFFNNETEAYDWLLQQRVK